MTSIKTLIMIQMMMRNYKMKKKKPLSYHQGKKGQLNSQLLIFSTDNKLVTKFRRK